MSSATSPNGEPRSTVASVQNTEHPDVSHRLKPNMSADPRDERHRKPDGEHRDRGRHRHAPQPAGALQIAVCLPGRTVEPLGELTRGLRRRHAPIQLRKVTKTRGSFPTDEAAMKLLYLAIRNISDQRGGEAGTGTHGWKNALRTC